MALASRSALRYLVGPGTGGWGGAGRDLTPRVAMACLLSRSAPPRPSLACLVAATVEFSIRSYDATAPEEKKHREHGSHRRCPPPPFPSAEWNLSVSAAQQSAALLHAEWIADQAGTDL